MKICTLAAVFVLLSIVNSTPAQTTQSSCIQGCVTVYQDAVSEEYKFVGSKSFDSRLRDALVSSKDDILQRTNNQLFESGIELPIEGIPVAFKFRSKEEVNEFRRIVERLSRDVSASLAYEESAFLTRKIPAANAMQKFNECMAICTNTATDYGMWLNLVPNKPAPRENFVVALRWVLTPIERQNRELVEKGLPITEITTLGAQPVVESSLGFSKDRWVIPDEGVLQQFVRSGEGPVVIMVTVKGLKPIKLDLPAITSPVVENLAIVAAGDETYEETRIIPDVKVHESQVEDSWGRKRERRPSGVWNAEAGWTIRSFEKQLYTVLDGCRGKRGGSDCCGCDVNAYIQDGNRIEFSYRIQSGGLPNAGRCQVWLQFRNISMYRVASRSAFGPENKITPNARIGSTEEVVLCNVSSLNRGGLTTVRSYNLRVQLRDGDGQVEIRDVSIGPDEGNYTDVGGVRITNQGGNFVAKRR